MEKKSKRAGPSGQVLTGGELSSQVTYTPKEDFEGRQRDSVPTIRHQKRKE